MAKLSVVVPVLLLGIVIAAIVPASFSPTGTMPAWQPAAAAEVAPMSAAGSLSAPLTTQRPTTETIYTTLLPVVTRTYLPRLACSTESPFGLQIAALHQVQSGEAEAYTTDTLSEAEWLALYEEAFPTLMEALEASGACWARFRVDWSWIQPDPPPADYVWGPYHDEKLRLIAETGVQLIGHIDMVPTWAGDIAAGPIYADRLDEFTQFLTDLVNRYKQPPYNMHHWELFNEADWVGRSGGLGWGANGDQYADMLRVAYPTIKAADPQATVLMGGLAYDWFYGEAPDGIFNRYFPDDVMDAGGADYLDALNFHYFPDFAAEWERWVPEGYPPTCGIVDDGIGASYDAWGTDVIAKANHFRNRMSACYSVDKPFWITEFGEHGYADDDASLAAQSRYVIQGYSRALAAGAKVAVWYTLLSPPYDTNEQGLLDEDDWSPKPAFYTYQMLTYELAGYTYASTLDVPNVEGYVFHKADSADKTTAWSSNSGTVASVKFASASQLRVVDRQGNITYVTDGSARDLDGKINGSIALRMTVEPVLVSR